MTTAVTSKMTELRLFLVLSCELRSRNWILCIIWVILLLIYFLCPLCFSRCSLCSWIIFSILWAIWGCMTRLMASITNDLAVVIRKLIFICCKSLGRCWVILSGFVIEFKELWIFAKLIILILILIIITIVAGLILIVVISKVITIVVIVVWEGSLAIFIHNLSDFLEFNTCFNQTLIATWMEANLILSTDLRVHTSLLKLHVYKHTFDSFWFARNTFFSAGG